MLERLADKVNANAALVRRGRTLDTTFLVEIGAARWLITIEEGRVASVTHSTAVMSNWSFALRAPEAAWMAFWQHVPKPGFHDLIALIKRRQLKAEGDMKVFMTHLRYFKEALGSLRAVENSS